MEQVIITPSHGAWAVAVKRDPNSAAKKRLVLDRFPVYVPTDGWVSDPFAPSAPMLAISTHTPQRTAVAQVDRILEALVARKGWVVASADGKPERPLYSIITEMMWQGDNATPAQRARRDDALERFALHLLRQHGRRL